MDIIRDGQISCQNILNKGVSAHVRKDFSKEQMADGRIILKAFFSSFQKPL
jgi:hypothetical protein